MTAGDINVLIACECSQVECNAFLAQGFNAYSCDISPVRRTGDPSRHIHGNVIPYLDGQTSFYTQDGYHHSVSKWHLIVAHPPCTYLCKLSSVQMVINGKINYQRYREMLSARRFFLHCLRAKADYVAVENPLPMKRASLPAPSFYACPSWYGHKYTKKTLYWSTSLPPLMPTLLNVHTKCFVRSSRGFYRSITFKGIAEAMANQWGGYILDELNK